MWSPQSELWTSSASQLYYRRWHLCFYFILYIRRTECKHLPSLPWRSVLKERRIGLLVVNDSGSSSHGPGTFTTDDCKKGQSCSRIWEILKSQWQKGGPSGWGRGWAAGRRRIRESWDSKVARNMVPYRPVIYLMISVPNHPSIFWPMMQELGL